MKISKLALGLTSLLTLQTGFAIAGDYAAGGGAIIISFHVNDIKDQ
jgi:hypothetical protein